MHFPPGAFARPRVVFLVNSLLLPSLVFCSGGENVGGLAWENGLGGGGDKVGGIFAPTG